MEFQDAEIEINRKNKKIVSVKLVVPVWHRLGEDGNIYASLPLFGIETYGKNENDLDVAIKDALEGFFAVCDKFGNGLEKELEALGWKQEKTHTNVPVFSVHPKNEMYAGMMKTGLPMAMMIQPKAQLRATA